MFLSLVRDAHFDLHCAFFHPDHIGGILCIANICKEVLTPVVMHTIRSIMGLCTFYVHLFLMERGGEVTNFQRRADIETLFSVQASRRGGGISLCKEFEVTTLQHTPQHVTLVLCTLQVAGQG